MRILVIADGRSPITRRWLEGLLTRGHAVSLISSFPCPPPVFDGTGEGLVFFRVLPVAFSQFLGGAGTSSNQPGKNRPVRAVIRRFRGLFLAGRYWLGPLSVRALASRFAALVDEAQPDLVHALRIPYEGMLASFTPSGVPLVVSIWGNDLTLHARGSPWMADLTRRTLSRATGLAADARRDLRLGVSWGFAEGKPSLVVPGSGGIHLEEVARAPARLPDSVGLRAGENGPLVINPRGLRPGSLRTDTFFKAVPLVLEQYPGARFICPSMAGQPEAEQWVSTLGLQEHVSLLPTLPQADLWSIFKCAQVFVSPSVHDGTPNSLLEGMACGCFPVVGDIESMREWIIPGVNGMLFPADDAQALAAAVCKGLADPILRERAAYRNHEIICSRADSAQVMDQVEAFYSEVLGR